MKFSLSTNWCNLRIESGEEIADKAIELGFDGLELGFNTSDFQVKGIRSRLDRLPVGSVHAFCPVPLSAPHGYPELYLLADADDAARGLASVHVKKNVVFAASMGADAVVLHAGRVMCRGFFRGGDMKRRVKRGRKRIDVFKRELEKLVPELEKNKVTLGLENLPYLEGFPAEWEIKDVVGDWVKPWLDTGHAFVAQERKWREAAEKLTGAITSVLPVGLHINDSQGGDDHLPPGEGKVDFAALKPVAEQARHLVFEPHAEVAEEALRKGLAHLKSLWA